MALILAALISDESKSERELVWFGEAIVLDVNAEKRLDAILRELRRIADVTRRRPRNDRTTRVPSSRSLRTLRGPPPAIAQT